MQSTDWYTRSGACDCIIVTPDAVCLACAHLHGCLPCTKQCKLTLSDSPVRMASHIQLLWDIIVLVLYTGQSEYNDIAE